MTRTIAKISPVTTFFCLIIISSSHAQPPPLPREWIDLPVPCVDAHDIGKLVLGISNKGYFGNSTYPLYYPCVLGETYYVGSEYPKNSLIKMLRCGSIWIGGVLGGDTLVTEGFHSVFWEGILHNHPPFSEMNPDDDFENSIIQRSTIKSSKHYDKDAISEQDFIAKYTDTIVNDGNPVDGHYGVRDPLDFRLHKPLYIEVTQKSYAWSLGYAEDFVIFEIDITNIGRHTIRDLAFGVVLESQMHYLYNTCGLSGPNCGRNLVGFLQNYPLLGSCKNKSELNLMWTSDMDGDPVNGQFTDQPFRDTTGNMVKSVRDVMGAMYISVPEDPEVWYNWWTYYYRDYSPMMKGNYRNFILSKNVPDGDRNKYFVLRNGEIDYDLAYISRLKPFDLNWIYPGQETIDELSIGNPFLYSLLSVYGGNLAPGSTIPIVFAVVAGENFHTDPDNYFNLPNNVPAYYQNLDFSDLAQNAQFAKWIYDNPGVDTDGDGYAGKFSICVFDSMLDPDSNWVVTNAETTWYEGDGVADWKVALPPPAPKMWVTPMFQGIHIRFNGQKSETTSDIFTHLVDFEGYRVYISRDDREQSYSRLASYDIENYDKYVWNEQRQPDPAWEILSFPMTLQEIRCNYALSCDDSLFDPLSFRISRPYQPANFPESLFYWEKHDANVYEFGTTTGITKVYPNARDPRTVPFDSLTAGDYTDDGYLKFFEYEFTIENILPTVGYYVSVTAFDFGWPEAHVDPLESSITDNAQAVYAELIDSTYAGNTKQVIVYPNPYRGDQRYRSRGFEGLGQDDRISQRVRRIHFANLPPKCIISIFSLDGDLVREIHHDADPSDPASSHVEWGLISRNGLAVVSGLYYWVVEFENGEVQMGKVAIIL